MGPKAVAPQPEKAQPEKKPEPETKIAEPAKPKPVEPKPAESQREQALKDQERMQSYQDRTPSYKVQPRPKPVAPAPEQAFKDQSKVPIPKNLPPPKPTRAYKAARLQYNDIDKTERYRRQPYFTREPNPNDQIGGYIRRMQYRDRWYAPIL